MKLWPDQEINDIYVKMSKFNVKLLTSYEIVSSSYVVAKVGEITELVQELNDLYIKVSQEHERAKALLENNKLLFKQLVREKMLSFPSEVRRLHTTTVLNYQAELEANQEYIVQQAMLAGIPVAQYQGPSLENEINTLTNYTETLYTILKILDHKRTELNRAESSVRLQCNSIQKTGGVLGGKPEEVKISKPSDSGGNGLDSSVALESLIS